MNKFFTLFTLLVGISIAGNSCKNLTVKDTAFAVELVCDIKAKLGEGSIWDYNKQVLYWVDIEEGILYEYQPDQDTTLIHRAGKKIGTIVPESDNTVVLAMEDGIYRMYLQNDSLEFITKPASLQSNQRFNDGKCDPAGRLWAGSMGPANSAYLYKMDAQGEMIPVLDNITISNGIIWSVDSTKMYYIDTPTKKIRQYDYSVADGSISAEKVIIEVPDSLGSPDGMTIDSEGNLWVAHWGGNAVFKYDPNTGATLQKIEVPAKNITSCAFGGNNLDVLYITCASIGMSDEEYLKYPDAGKLFRVRTGVKGIKANFIKISQ